MSGASRPATDLARIVADRCDELARISSSAESIRRVYLTPEHARANALAAVWMAEAGLRTWEDAAGNLHGRVAGDDARPVLLIGSHLDTVVDAGRYDGIVGVLTGIAVVELLGDRVTDLPVAIEVVAFSDEEGTRFGKALLGSSAMAGVWDDAWWDLADDDGVTLREAFTAHGLDPARVREAAVDPATLAGYLEAHIEQGPYLERAGQALGVVTSIAAARRFSVDVVGEARHAGGTPYEMRHDALLGAAEAALAVERICIDEQHIGTVGSMHVEPGAVNVVPGHARFSVDLRGEFDDGRDRVWDAIEQAFAAIAVRRGLEVTVSEVHRAPAVLCAPHLMDAVRAGITATGQHEPLELFSRAGHDAMSLGQVTDVAMLFLRNPGGISHHPDEFVSTEDVAVGIDAMTTAVLAVAAGVATPAGVVPQTTDADAEVAP